MSDTCRSCQTAAHILRRIGLKDTISWGVIGHAPTQTIHATMSNAGNYIDRQETKEEYNRRLQRDRENGVEPKPFGQFIREYPLQPLCRFYSNELMWLTAGRPTRTTVYLAHPVSGKDFHDNVRGATVWLRYLRRLPQSSLYELMGCEFSQRPLILCPWLAAIEEDEFYPGGREAIIADARDTVLMFDEVWLVGGRISDGMRIEAQTARVLRDITHLGDLPGVDNKRRKKKN